MSTYLCPKEDALFWFIKTTDFRWWCLLLIMDFYRLWTVLIIIYNKGICADNGYDNIDYINCVSWLWVFRFVFVSVSTAHVPPVSDCIFIWEPSQVYEVYLISLSVCYVYIKEPSRLYLISLSVSYVYIKEPSRLYLISLSVCYCLLITWDKCYFHHCCSSSICTCYERIPKRSAADKSEVGILDTPTGAVLDTALRVSESVGEKQSETGEWDFVVVVDWLIDWFIHSFIHSFIHWLIDWFIDWLIDGWMDGWMDWWIDRSIDWLMLPE